MTKILLCQQLTGTVTYVLNQTFQMSFQLKSLKKERKCLKSRLKIKNRRKNRKRMPIKIKFKTRICMLQLRSRIICSLNRFRNRIQRQTWLTEWVAGSQCLVQPSQCNSKLKIYKTRTQCSRMRSPKNRWPAMPTQNSNCSKSIMGMSRRLPTASSNL